MTVKHVVESRAWRGVGTALDDALFVPEVEGRCGCFIDAVLEIHHVPMIRLRHRPGEGDWGDSQHFVIATFPRSSVHTV